MRRRTVFGQARGPIVAKLGRDLICLGVGKPHEMQMRSQNGNLLPQHTSVFAHPGRMPAHRASGDEPESLR